MLSIYIARPMAGVVWTLAVVLFIILLPNVIPALPRLIMPKFIN